MPSVSVQPALRAMDFVQSIGVTMHLEYADSTYANVSTVLDQLSYIGVQHARVAAPGTNSVVLAAEKTLGAAGIKFDMVVMGNLTAAMPSIDALASYVVSVEGPNEVNVTPPQYNGLIGTPAAIAFQKALYAAVHADPILNNATHSTPVINFSVSIGNNPDYSVYGNMSAYADYTNVHAYGQGGIPSPWFVPAEIAAVTDTPNRPVIVTETGNYTMLDGASGVSQAVQAKLSMDTLLDDFKSGIISTYLYQLSDGYADPGNINAEDHYGLFNADGTPKLAATALHNLTNILADTGAAAQTFTTLPLTYSLKGLPATGSQLLMEKSNGAYDITLWQEPKIWNAATNSEISIAPSTVTVTLGRVYQTINVYDPLVGTAPIATYHNVSSVQVALGTGALVVEVEPDIVNPGKSINTGSAGGVFFSTGNDTVVAGSGAATVSSGTGAATTVTGSTGSLVATLTASKASIIGGSGALTITSNSGSNTIIGGSGAFSYTDLSGNDLVATGTSASNKVTLGTGSDTILAGSGLATITGGTGATTITGSTGTLSINGGMGSLNLAGGSGDEWVFTQTGTKNLLKLGNGTNTVVSRGADTITAGAGLSKIYTAGPALITGTSGALVVNSQGGATTVNGGSGALTVTSRSGSNTITGGSGAFSYTDLAGNDLVTTGTSASNRLTLGTGSDTILAGSGSATVTGGTGATTITGSTGALLLTLNGSKSAVTGGAGILGVTDNVGGNIVTGGAGALTLSVKSGNDVITTNNTTGTSLITLGTGTNTVVANGVTSITGGAGSSTITANGTTSINGGMGSLNLAGGNGDEWVFTQTGTQNLLKLGNGTNTVLSHGADTITAGAGLSKIYAAGPTLITGGTGKLTVSGQGGAVTVMGGVGSVNASTIGDNSSLQGGSAGGNMLSVSSGNTTLVGGGSGDVLTDTGSGNNLLVASAGATTLSAGSGNDTLVGGAGADIFVLTAAGAAHNEVIWNFNSATDQLKFVGFGSTAAIASQQTSGGSLLLTLSDQTQVNLVGVTKLV